MRQNAQVASELEVPWIDVINELRSVQHSYRQLRTEITSRQAALTTRMERLEDCLSTIMQDQNNTAENNRDLQNRMEQFSTQVQRLNDRIRTQDWYHDASEEESHEETERQLASAKQRYEKNRYGAQQRREESRTWCTATS